MKKFLLPFQNMVRADLFSGSLAVWNVRDFAIHFAHHHRISMRLFAEGVGFEPTSPVRDTAFQAVPLDRSGTPP